MTTVTADTVQSAASAPRWTIETLPHGGFKICVDSEVVDEIHDVLVADTNSGDGSGRTVTLQAGSPDNMAYGGLEAFIQFLEATEAANSWATIQADTIELITKDLGNPAGSGRGVRINGVGRANDGETSGVDTSSTTKVSTVNGRVRVYHGLSRVPTDVNLTEIETQAVGLAGTTQGYQAYWVQELTTDQFFVVQWRNAAGAIAGNGAVHPVRWEAKVLVNA